MNKIEALNEKALEAAAKALIDRDPTISGYHPSHIEAKKADAEEAIRAYLTASDAEREPDFWAVHSRTGVHVGLWRDKDDAENALKQYMGGTITALYAAPLPLTDLEAENARLKAEVERLRELASELPIVKYALRATEARLAEALKALEEAKRTNFNIGYTLAVANLINLHDTPSVAADVMAQTDITLKEITAMGLSDYDLKPLRKMFREEPVLLGNGRAARRVREGGE